MEPKRSKYDTNPLDERVSDNAGQSLDSSRPGPPTKEVGGGPTRDVGRRNENAAVQGYAESEAPTQRINDNLASSYPSVFIKPPPRQSTAYQPPRVPAASIYQPPPAPPPSIYQPPPMPVTLKPGSNKVAGLGIPEKWAVILPYMPFYLAMVAALVELLLAPRTETRVRFHAAQGLALQIGITAISTLLTFAGAITGRWTGAGLFSLASGILLIVSMVRLWKGKPLSIPPLEEPTKWLDQKIKPRK
jgi:uncharacterized membrane protein